MQILRYADYPVRPWKNGGGTTREIAVSPADGADFTWRLSLAEVSRSGPFSVYPGYDRMIMLLEGDGCRLALADGTAHDLVEAFVPYAFAGEANVACTVLGRPSKDLNLMTRRGRVRAGWEVMDAAATLEPAGAADQAVRIIVCLDGRAAMSSTLGGAETLERWDTAILEPGESVGCRGRTRLLSICIEPEPRC